MASETKQLTTNRTATANSGGMNETCHQKRHKEDYDDGNAVKAHLDLQDVLEENSQAQVKHKEYPDRSKRPKVTFFHFDYSSLFA